MRRLRKSELPYKYYLRLKDSVLFKVSHYKGDLTWAIEKAFTPKQTKKISVSYDNLKHNFKGITVTGYPTHKFTALKELYREQKHKY